jgi:chromosome segregation ATPase
MVKAVDMKGTLAGFERTINEARAEIQSITEEQNRIRENMRTVDRNSPYYNRLMTKLNEQESAIETLQTQIDKDTESMEKARVELETYLAGLTVG